MTKMLKMYIPIVTKGVVKKKGTYRFILVGVHNCKTISKHMPTIKDISEHLQIQKYRTEHQEKFMSIKVNLNPEEFEVVRKEISSKIGYKYQPSIVDIVFELGQIPIIQIIPNVSIAKEEKEVEFSIV